MLASLISFAVVQFARCGPKEDGAHQRTPAQPLFFLGKEERIKEEHIFSPFMGSGGVLLLGSFCGCA